MRVHVLRVSRLHRPAMRMSRSGAAACRDVRGPRCRLRRLRLRLRLKRVRSAALMDSLQDIAVAIVVGIVATAVMDCWLSVLARLGVPTTDWRLVGRWVGQLHQGRFAHASIAHSPAVRGEHALGWLTHYAVGVVYAIALVAMAGHAWLTQPTVAPALAFGIVSVVMPLFGMQPAMGYGFAASKTPTPARNCSRALVNHGVFGLGLYIGAALIAFL